MPIQMGRLKTYMSRQNRISYPRLRMLTKPMTALFGKCLSRYRTPTSSFHNAATYSKQVPLKSSKFSNFLVFCNSQITKHGRNGDIKEAESIFNRIPNKSSVSWTAMLTAYAVNGKLKEAQQVFEKMPHRSVPSYNAMITAYVRNGCMVDEAYELFRWMPEHNAVSFAAMITGFVQAKMFDRAEQIYAGVPTKLRDPVCSNALMSGYLKDGRLDDAFRIFQHMVEKDLVSYSSMINGYCRSGKVNDARNVFDQMLERNVVTWTAMIDGYMKTGCFLDGFTLFFKMRREGTVAPNPTTLTVLLDACGDYDRYLEGIQIHGLELKSGFDYDVFLGNSIIAMYCRLSCINAAMLLFNEMKTKDLVSWNSIIAGCAQNSYIEEAYRLFQKMPKKDVVSWTTIISSFFSQQNISKAVELFKIMPEHDEVAWTTMVSGFLNNEEYEAAFYWFAEMLRKGGKPNAHTFSSVLAATAGLATLEQGLQIHAQAVKRNLEFDLSIQNSLVTMYSKCGNVTDAHRVFMSITEPNVVSFNSMITGFSHNGYGEKALKIFWKMQNECLEPNEITFLSVLSACTHVGLVDIGKKYFESMASVYNIEPGPDHYACMVDLLGRAGMLDEAIALIHSMPSEPHSGVWGALLSACRTYLRLDLAELASQHLAKLEPVNATSYVVLSNLYFVLGRDHESEKLRMTEKVKGLKKSPGYSWVTVRDKVHLFVAGGEYHQDMEKIRLILWMIGKETEELFAG